jgi:hypothetical protein
MIEDPIVRAGIQADRLTAADFMIENDDCAGLCDPTENEFFKIFKNFFFHFAVSFALLSTGIRLARAPKGKGKYPTVKKRAESAMEKNGWVKSCSFFVWLLEKSRKKKKKDKASWNHLALIC